MQTPPVPIVLYKDTQPFSHRQTIVWTPPVPIFVYKDTQPWLCVKPCFSQTDRSANPSCPYNLYKDAQLWLCAKPCFSQTDHYANPNCPYSPVNRYAALAACKAMFLTDDNWSELHVTAGTAKDTPPILSQPVQCGHATQTLHNHTCMQLPPLGLTLWTHTAAGLQHIKIAVSIPLTYQVSLKSCTRITLATVLRSAKSIPIGQNCSHQKEHPLQQQRTTLSPH